MCFSRLNIQIVKKKLYNVAGEFKFISLTILCRANMAFPQAARSSQPPFLLTGTFSSLKGKRWAVSDSGTTHLPGKRAITDKERWERLWSISKTALRALLRRNTCQPPGSSRSRRESFHVFSLLFAYPQEEEGFTRPEKNVRYRAL